METQTAASAAQRNPGTADSSLTGENEIYSLITRRLLPVLLTAFCIAYLDRINVGLAKLQMASDLGFSDAVYGFGAGIFYLAYAIFEVPSNLIMHRVGARRWIARIAVSWGLVSMCMLFVRTPASFYALRLLLGMAECGLFPGIILYLTYWYPAHRRGRIVALFMAALPISGLVGGPLSGWIMQRFAGMSGLHGWQWLFFIEALPAVAIGVVIWFVLPDRVNDARWLTDDQKRVIARNIATENAEKPSANTSSVFTNPRIWLMSLMLFAFATGNMGISFWLPTIVQRAGHGSSLSVGLLTAIPYAFAAVAMIALSMSSDKRRERRWHLALPAFGGAALLALSTVWSNDLTMTIVTMTAASMCVFAVAPLLWAQPTALLSGSAAAAGIAMISSLGNLAGLFSPSLFGYLTVRTHSTSAGMFLLAGFMLLGGLLSLVTPARLVNK
ncbi:MULTISPECIES: MFS transporter [Burkholderiaceae]|uniref:Nitrate/nitrite transporter n=1 Tax=Caballeronia sordidicola TaxID=196367 RepID=A0A242MMU9_CABSO|nr:MULTISPECIES: MFS transporter [Burkholderiaceae]AME25955.1 MFS transporter [Burkholderia sp. PAMC 26561]OTP72647.1 Nitrate/nitrite transporter [Caballeronia sordidicola]